jgi:hypothetical protein
MIEIQDVAGVPRLLNIESIVEASPAPGDVQMTRVVLRNGAEYRLPMPYPTFRGRLRTLLDRMLPIDREVSV